MFKARNLVTSQDVVILDVADKAQLEALREQARQEELACPGCLQAVVVRAGEVKRAHFAHRHLENCPLAQDSIELLDARAALYQWLAAKFPGEVTLEKQLPDTRLGRAVDCWVEHKGRRFAYWIADRRIKPEDRAVIVRAVESAGAGLNVVLHIQMMERSAAKRGIILLSTTEREFITHTRFDEVHGRHAGSLHYVDPDRLTMTTFRGLELVESPQRYRGEELCTPLASLLVLPSTGEIVHPDEQSRLDQWLARKREEERRAQEAERLRKEQERAAQQRRHEEAQRRRLEEERRREEWQRQEMARLAAVRMAQTEPAGALRETQRVMSETAGAVQAAQPPVTPPPAQPGPPPAAVEPEPEGTCEICGARTRDWVVYRGKTGMCVCRKCAMAKQKARDASGRPGG